MDNQQEKTGGKLIKVDIDSEMRKSFLEYSMSVIIDRALPDVRDGLKPVHRRILYTTEELGLTPDKPHRKSAKIVGDVLGSFHPHGDASVYDAMVRMAQTFSLRYPLIDGHGNFGSIDGHPAAAYRYTEARMSKVARFMLDDIEKDVVDFVPNYDDSKKEPTVLPARFPNLLVNGSTGIAVGMATNIPPHNMGEVIDAVCLLIDNPEATMEEIMEHIKGPDFPTRGIIMGHAGIRSAYASGRGKITLRARAEIQEFKNGREQIIISEIPYMVNKSRLLERMGELVKEKRIEMISDVRDESDKDGLRIVVELKREANAQVVLNQLYSFSQLQDTVGVIMIALVDGVPKVLNLKEVLQEYIKFQYEIITRRTKFELKKAQAREHILEGLKIVVDNTDEVIKIIRQSKDVNDAKANLIARFSITDIQASAVVAMALGRLSGMERIKIEEELAEIVKRIEELTFILQHDEEIFRIVKEEIAVIRAKYGDERRTEIQMVTGEVDMEDLIPVTECALTLTHLGYIKRQPMDVYRSQRRGGRGVTGMTRREEDYVEELFTCSTHDYILFFTSHGKAYRLKGYEIPESTRVSKGNHVANILPLEKEEKITAMIRMAEIDETRFLVMATRQGTVKRTPLVAYKNIRKGGLIAINLDEDDELAWVKNTSGNNELMIATAMGKIIRFNETDVRSVGRTAKGVRGIRLDTDDYVVSMARVRENTQVLTITEKGAGRRTNLEEYRVQSRGGKGIINYKVSNKDTLVAGVLIVNEEDDVIIISDDGVIIRFPVEQINSQSRYGGGVKAMRIAEGSRVVAVARTEKEPEQTQEYDEDGNPIPPANVDGEAANVDSEAVPVDGEAANVDSEATPVDGETAEPEDGDEN